MSLEPLPSARCAACSHQRRSHNLVKGRCNASLDGGNHCRCRCSGFVAPAPTVLGDAALTLVLPMPEPVTNRRGGNGWRTVHNEKKRYAAACDDLQLRGAIPPPPSTPWEHAIISSVMYLGGAMDDDNALVRHKVAIDWLKTRGYIAEDKKKVLTWESLPEQIVKRDGNYRLVLTIRPIAA